jgi:hypothetical protein
MFALVVHYVMGNIPVWIWPFAAGGGAVVYFFSGVVAHFPQFKPYAMFIKPVAGLVFVFGVFMYGGSGVVAVYQEDLKEAEHQAELASQASDAANKQLETVLASQKHLIKGRTYGVKQTIEANRAAVNAECKLSDTAWLLYNSASQNKVAESLRGATTAAGQPTTTQ